MFGLFTVTKFYYGLRNARNVKTERKECRITFTFASRSQVPSLVIDVLIQILSPFKSCCAVFFRSCAGGAEPRCRAISLGSDRPTREKVSLLIGSLQTKHQQIKYENGSINKNGERVVFLCRLRSLFIHSVRPGGSARVRSCQTRDLLNLSFVINW